MNRSTWVTLLLASGACSAPSDGQVGDTDGIDSLNLPASSGTLAGSGTTAPMEPDPHANTTDPMSPKYDVAAPNDPFCVSKPAGDYCDQNTHVVCGADGSTVQRSTCGPEFCLEGTGCVVCLAGQFGCLGDRVLQCDDLANPPAWQEIQTCDGWAAQTCDRSTGTCVPAQPIGFDCATDDDCEQGHPCDPTAHQCVTGTYYKFADFSVGSGLRAGGYDVDARDNRIYIATSGTTVDVYEIELLDSDNDGQLEPNQHPENPDNTGPIEERVLTFIETCGPTSPTCPLPLANLSPGGAELYIGEDRLFAAGVAITEYPLDGSAATQIAVPTGAVRRISHLGFDDQNQIWYGSNESGRRVYQYNATTASWGIAFDYPVLAGTHMDGLEVITQPGTGVVYVYVSDMTSDFIGQYRIDPELGWVQENLFAYHDDAKVVVEGMGFGALNHFWATGGSTLYEVGGGDLAAFVEPPA